MIKAVAVCPTCNAWFPSFEERNEHRKDEHSAAASARRIAQANPAAEQVVTLESKNVPCGD